MNGYIILGIVILIFLTISILLLLGKGSFLISGYNTASKEEKEVFNKKKLCRAFGVFSLFITILITILGYITINVETGHMSESTMKSFGLLFPFAILTGTILVAVYANKKCKK